MLVVVLCSGIVLDGLLARVLCSRGSARGNVLGGLAALSTALSGPMLGGLLA